jgi:hypothetical protein
MGSMKRDMDLARKILFEVEKTPFKVGWTDVTLVGYSEEEISYHIMILSEAGLLHAMNIGHGATNIWKATFLSWEGHEFLDAARDNGRWEKVMAIVTPIGGFVFEIVKPLLVDLMKAQLHLP